jgi:transposase
VEEKVRIVIAGLRADDSIVELCRKERNTRISTTADSRSFSRPERKRLGAYRAADDQRRSLRTASGGAQQLKELSAELVLENRPLKKGVLGDGAPDN